MIFVKRTAIDKFSFIRYISAKLIHVALITKKEKKGA